MAKISSTHTHTQMEKTVKRYRENIALLKWFVDFRTGIIIFVCAANLIC